jgi:hypothetical protein
MKLDPFSLGWEVDMHDSFARNECHKNELKGRTPKMVVDFQHHYVPVALAKRRGLYTVRS